MATPRKSFSDSGVGKQSGAFVQDLKTVFYRRVLNEGFLFHRQCSKLSEGSVKRVDACSNVPVMSPKVRV